MYAYAFGFLGFGTPLTSEMPVKNSFLSMLFIYTNVSRQMPP